MAEIELVIKIPEEDYRSLQKKDKFNDRFLNYYEKLIVHGTPLPKGHGRIGDLDALRCENADFDTYNDYCIMFDEIEAAETIIEADKGD
jgi:hypothetical protein